ncbi:MAG: NHL repeat-containing protein [Candidatus Micrarchaeota archaeon]
MRLAGVFAVLFAFLPLYALSLSIEYVPPTPANNSVIPAGYATVNVTLDQNAASCTLYWGERITVSTPNVWVANLNSNTVSRVIASDGNVAGNFTVQSQPGGVAVDALGNVWICNNNANTVSRVNAGTGEVTGNYTVQTKPTGVAADALGNIWVANSGSDTVSRINASTGEVTGNYTVQDRPEQVAADALGNIWVANFGSDTVSRINASTGEVTGNYTVQHWPYGVAADALGNIWVSNNFDGTVSRVNASTGEVTGNYTVQQLPEIVAADALGNVWVANFLSHTVSRINASTGEVTGNYTVQQYPSGVAADALGNVWVTNSFSDTVSRVNASNGNVTGNFTVGDGPQMFGDATGFALQYFVLNRVWTSYAMTVVNAGAGTYAYHAVTGLVPYATYQYYAECTGVSADTNSTPPDTVYTNVLANITIVPAYSAFTQGTGPRSVQFTPACTLVDGSAVACPPLNWTTNLTDASINAAGYLTLQADAVEINAVNASFYSFPGPYGPSDVPLAANSSWVEVIAASPSPSPSPSPSASPSPSPSPSPSVSPGPTPEYFAPSVQTAGILLLSCPNIAPTNQTNVTVQCFSQGTPCIPGGISLAGGIVLAQYLQGTGGFIYTVDTRLAGVYSLTASYSGLGASSCKFTRVSGTVATQPLPDFNPLLAFAVGASALMLARRRIRR